MSMNVKKKTLDPKERKKFILEGFPGIGPTTAKALLEKFKTLKNIFSKSKKELVKTGLFDEKKLDNFKRILES